MTFVGSFLGPEPFLGILGMPKITQQRINLPCAFVNGSGRTDSSEYDLGKLVTRRITNCERQCDHFLSSVTTNTSTVYLCAVGHSCTVQYSAVRDLCYKK